MKVSFLFIGPDKSGSSWMYEVLREHPHCFVPELKDIYFFDRFYNKGLDWYRGFFRDVTCEHEAVGEMSHDYLFSEAAAERILQDLGPDVRIFCCLRNPIERSFSHYLYLKRNGLTTKPFREALDDWDEIVDKSLYGKHLPAYLNRFPGENFRIFLFDDLKADPDSFARELLGFLGLEFNGYVPPRTRAASAPRSPRLSRLVTLGAQVARHSGLGTIVGRLKRGPLQKILYREYQGADKPVLSPEDRDHLRDIFLIDYERYRAFLPRDMRGWFEQ